MRVFQAVEGVTAQVVSNMSPALASAAELITNVIESAGGVEIGARISDYLYTGAEVLATYLDAAWQGLVAAW